MKYLKATVLIGFPDDEIATWSEHADVTFALAGLHEPQFDQYLISHDEFPTITEEEARTMMHKCFDENGGV